MIYYASSVTACLFTKAKKKRKIPKILIIFSNWIFFCSWALLRNFGGYHFQLMHTFCYQRWHLLFSFYMFQRNLEQEFYAHLIVYKPYDEWKTFNKHEWVFHISKWSRWSNHQEWSRWPIQVNSMLNTSNICHMQHSLKIGYHYYVDREYIISRTVLQNLL